MTHKFLLMASAAVTLLAVTSSAQAHDCLRMDRTEASLSKVFHRTDRTFKRAGDTFTRTGDRMFGWIKKRSRVDRDFL